MGSLQDERAEEKAFDREKVRFIPSRSLSHGANLILCSNSREESEETRLVEDSCVSYLISHFANPFWRNSRPFSPVRRPQQRHRGKSVVKLYPASGLLASLSLSLSLLLSLTSLDVSAVSRFTTLASHSAIASNALCFATITFPRRQLLRYFCDTGEPLLYRFHHPETHRA